MNPYLKNLNRLEFLITFACTGRCKHCSEGEHTSSGESIDGEIAAGIVRKVARHFDINSLMTFGGEPLLYPNDIYQIHAAARDVGIPHRQLITNGFFSRDEDTIQHVAKNILESGANNILLSVDAFHQETIPIEPVMVFAKAIHKLGVPYFRVHPAWLVSEEADNPYNNQTRKILADFNTIGIPASDGNVIFPSGNALKYLSEYFDLRVPHTNPYEENPQDITTIGVDPNGDILGGNIYKTDILEILENNMPE